MTHFTLLDNKTFEFLLRLKSCNTFWFTALVNCAKDNPKLAQSCLEKAAVMLPYTHLDATNVNVFQICKAANAGMLEVGLFAPTVQGRVWNFYRESVITKLKTQDKYIPKPKVAPFFK